MKNTRIMVVEDEQMLQQAYKTMLEFKGYDVITANNGVEAIKALKKGPLPHIILLDMLMPHMDGLSFLEESQITKDHPEIKVILFSNFSNSGRQKELQGFGVAAQVLKSSVSPRDLLELVAKHTS